MTEDTSTNSPDDAEKGEGSNSLYVPLAALAEDGAPAPQVGDKVAMQVEGVIHSVTGGTACVTPEMVNDQPVAQAPKQTSLRDTVKQQMADLDNTSY